MEERKEREGREGECSDVSPSPRPQGLLKDSSEVLVLISQVLVLAAQVLVLLLGYLWLGSRLWGSGQRGPVYPS